MSDDDDDKKHDLGVLAAPRPLRPRWADIEEDAASDIAVAASVTASGGRRCKPNKAAKKRTRR